MQNTIIHIQDTQWRCCFASLVAVVIRLHLNKQTWKEMYTLIWNNHVKTILFLFLSDNIMKTTNIVKGIHHQVIMESYVK